MKTDEKTTQGQGDAINAETTGGQIPRELAKTESKADRLRGTTTPDTISVDLVSAFSGDRDMTEAEKDFIRELKESRGNVFFSDLFYAVSHHYFAPEIAEALWINVLSHKQLISRCLDRNVRITVATLDYLSNIRDDLTAPTLIGEAYVSEIANLSMRDGMTGLFNHSSCYELLEVELRQHRRFGGGVAFLLLDIDDFKSVNDRYGHQEGDQTLVALAKTLTAQTRESDICCRLGGDEFGVILPNTNAPNEIFEVAERIRTKVASIPRRGKKIAVSVGIALCNDATASARKLVKGADSALYKAKMNGKNRIVLDIL
jgi:diguanylate cyclase (GGDEF)-like protein